MQVMGPIQPSCLTSPGYQPAKEAHQESKHSYTTNSGDPTGVHQNSQAFPIMAGSKHHGCTPEDAWCNLNHTLPFFFAQRATGPR